MITLKMVKTAYANKGLKPVAGTFTPINGQCCALGALAKDEHDSLHKVGDRYKVDGWEFACGFDNGFTADMATHRSMLASTHKSYLAGVKIGRVLRANQLRAAARKKARNKLKSKQRKR